MAAGDRDCFVDIVGFDVDFPVADAYSVGF
jgi:hypothetical protein